MYKYIIEGETRIQGEVDVSGSKNASLPILAASILNSGITKLYNIPDIEDVRITLEILKRLGCKVERTDNAVIVNSKDVKETTIPDELMRKLRSSIVIVGAIIARFKEANFTYPRGM